MPDRLDRAGISNPKTTNRPSRANLVPLSALTASRQLTGEALANVPTAGRPRKHSIPSTRRRRRTFRTPAGGASCH